MPARFRPKDVNAAQPGGWELLCRLRLTLPGAAQDAFHRVIAFMAGVFDDGTLTLRHRDHCRPRFRPRGRIVSREFVQERFLAGARETLDQMCVRTGTFETRLALEIDGVDNQRITLPMSARVPIPLTNAPMRTRVQGDDASAVDHFIKNHNMSRSLEQLHTVVVGARNHGRSGVETHKAAFL